MEQLIIFRPASVLVQHTQQAEGYHNSSNPSYLYRNKRHNTTADALLALVAVLLFATTASSLVSTSSGYLPDPLSRHIHLALHPRHILVQQSQHFILHLQLLLNLYPQLLLPRHRPRQHHHVLVLLLHHLFLQLHHALVVERARPIALFTQHAARGRFRGTGEQSRGFGFIRDGPVDGGFGHHGREQVFEPVFFALGAREEVAAPAELALAEFGTAPGGGRGYVCEAGVEGLDHGACSDEEFLGLGGGFVLGLRCGGLVPPREMETGVV